MVSKWSLFSLFPCPSAYSNLNNLPICHLFSISENFDAWPPPLSSIKLSSDYTGLYTLTLFPIISYVSHLSSFMVNSLNLTCIFHTCVCIMSLVDSISALMSKINLFSICEDSYSCLTSYISLQLVEKFWES